MVWMILVSDLCSLSRLVELIYFKLLTEAGFLRLSSDANADAIGSLVFSALICICESLVCCRSVIIEYT